MLHGVVAERELAIEADALGSIRNKLLFILPCAAAGPFRLGYADHLLANLPGLEGAEKVWHKLSGQHDDDKPAVEKGPEEKNRQWCYSHRPDSLC